jgi:hypothetical protein
MIISIILIVTVATISALTVKIIDIKMDLKATEDLLRESFMRESKLKKELDAIEEMLGEQVTRNWEKDDIIPIDCSELEEKDMRDTEYIDTYNRNHNMDAH